MYDNALFVVCGKSVIINNILLAELNVKKHLMKISKDKAARLPILLTILLQ